MASSVSWMVLVVRWCFLHNVQGFEVFYLFGGCYECFKLLELLGCTLLTKFLQQPQKRCQTVFSGWYFYVFSTISQVSNFSIFVGVAITISSKTLRKNYNRPHFASEKWRTYPPLPPPPTPPPNTATIELVPGRNCMRMQLIQLPDRLNTYWPLAYIIYTQILYDTI